jgi:hypothetical protein
MSKRVYTLDVYITEGPMTEDFVDRNPTVCRTIEIRGNQTLERLHAAIFKACDRFDEHLYEFQFGEGPHDPNGRRYILNTGFEGPIAGPDEPAGDVAKTTMDSLGLAVGQSFGYWFDFGDDWYHQISVAAIGEPTPKVRYPRVTKRVGESPPQYVDWDEEAGGEE